MVMLAAAGGHAAAVELGEPQVRSFMGQPLSADIELTGLSSDTATIQAGVADAEVYRAASLQMPAALANAIVTTFRREGRRYLHISAATPIRADHLPIFFTLTENGQKSVRQVTLWLSADPNPPPPPPAPPALVIAPAVPMPPPAVAAVAATVPPAHVAPPLRPLQLAAHADSGRRLLQLARPASAACPARNNATDTDGDSCAALGASNAALTAHLSELEDKVKQLSVALQGTTLPTVVITPLAAVAKAAPPKPLPPKLVPMGSKAVETTSKPWLVIAIVAAIILSLIAGLVVVLLRQRAKARRRRAAETPAAASAAVRMPNFIAKLKSRLMPRRAAAEVVAGTEVANTAPAG
ncbi:hypothetical protein [Massilia sp. PWRC2]|uniref:FimV/HubP-related protein n=1 Tax=Massilia sp. PWRC2 TaxID=2804626 RepID=UPI003CEA40DB